MATMKQVARLAGVSRFTVSKVFNGQYVSEKTREKVNQACEKLHYRRNLYATNLVRKESFTIGMIISQNYDSFFGEIIDAAQREAYAHGYQLLCQCSHGDADEETKIINNFESLQVCGLIVAPVVNKSQLKLWDSLGGRLPVVHFDCYLRKNSHYVMTDNVLSATMVTEHLLDAGRTPAYLGSVHPDTNLAIKNRKKGYVDAVTKRGLSPCIISTAHSEQTMDNQQFGYDNLTAYLEDHAPPEALFCATDRIAMGAIFALQKRGLTVGKDVLVAGHDNLTFGAFMNPTLTTVAQPKQDMGRECVKSLLSLMHQTGPSPEKLKKILQPELIIRQSTTLYAPQSATK